MTLIQRYFASQIWGPLFAILGGLIVMALLSQGLTRLDIIVEQRQSAFEFLWVTALAVPQLTSLILPLAVFFAVAYAVNRLHSESEIVVAQAAGVSGGQLIGPVLRVAVLAALAHLAVTTILQPAAFREMRETLFAIRGDVAASLVREGAFTSPADNLTIYARDASSGGELRDVLIEDSRGAQPLTYVAKTGLAATVDGKPTMVLRNGQIMRPRADGGIDALDFDQYAVALAEFQAAPEYLILKPSDRFLAELFFPDPSHFYDQRNIKEFIAEGHARISAPLLNPAMALIALAGLLGGEFSRRGYSGRLSRAAALALAVRLAALGVQAACADTPSLNVLQYVLPIVVGAGAAYLIVTARPKAPKRQEAVITFGLDAKPAGG